MNQGRVWCVVSPTVGLPLLIGSVALTSLIVHAEILSHVSWFGGYWNGAAKMKMSGADPQGQTAQVASQTGAPAFTITVTPATASAGAAASSFVVTVAPNQTAAADTTPKAPGKLALSTQTTN
jgi:light-harvesting protein B-800-850 alpha chain